MRYRELIIVLALAAYAVPGFSSVSSEEETFNKFLCSVKCASDCNCISQIPKEEIVWLKLAFQEGEVRALYDTYREELAYEVRNNGETVSVIFKIRKGIYLFGLDINTTNGKIVNKGLLD